MQTMCKSGLYPTSEQEQSLLFVMKICWWVYNHFLSIWDSVAKMPSRYDLQVALLELKKNHPNLKKVVLFMQEC